MLKHKRKPVIHIGMFKAGSTSLQENVFSRHSQILNIWKPTYEEILRQAINLEENELPRQDIESFIRSRREQASNENKVLVASNEQIIGLPTITLAATRLKEFIPDAKILMVVREQRALIRSYYMYQCRRLSGYFGVPKKYEGLPVDFKDFFEWHIPADMNESQHKTQKFLQLAWRLKYAKTIALYEDLFGRENVEVLPIEKMRAAPAAFARRLGDFMQIDAGELERLFDAPAKNTSPVHTEFAYERWRSRFPRIPFSRFLPFSDHIKPWIKNVVAAKSDDAMEIDPEMEQRIVALYSSENRKIQEKYKLDLEKYGYVL